MSTSAPAPGVARDLVVAYCYPPYVDTSAIVAAKRVREHGRPVDVLQNALGSLRRTDPTLERIAGDLVVRRHEVPSRSHFASWGAMSQFVEMGLQQALAWDREGAGYERVYSRAQFVASHLLAARLVLQRPDLRWTAEFSDPLSLDVTGATRRSAAGDGVLLRRLAEGLRAAGFEPPTSHNAFEWVEVLPYALAEELVFTNERQRDLMASRVEDERLRARVLERATVSPHPTLPPEFYALASPGLELEPERVHLGYFGNFYASRGMDTVLDALRGLPERLRDRLVLHVFAGSRKELDAQVHERGLGRWVRTRPFVDYLDFLALATRMDVLLVNDAVTRGSDLPVNPYLPSKLSDYLGSGRPVWGIVEEGSPMSALDLAHRSPVGHVTAAVQVLARIATRG